MLLVVFLITSILLVVQPVHGQEKVRSFTIIPPAIQQPLQKGQTAEGVLKIVNETEAPITFKASVQDFIVSDTHGTPTFLPPNTLSKNYSAASWIAISPNTFTVAPHKRAQLQYFLQVPLNGRPGGHYAAVVYHPVVDKGVDSTGATVNAQIGTLFYITVDGPIKEYATITRFFVPGFQEYGPVAIQTQVKNFGDQHIRPIGTVTVKNMLGGKTIQALEQRNIFPQAARDYVNIFGQKFMFGRYEATFAGTYGKNNTLPLMATVVFWVFPWKITLVIILILIALILSLMLMRKKDTQPPSTETSTAEEKPLAPTETG